MSNRVGQSVLAGIAVLVLSCGLHAQTPPKSATAHPAAPAMKSAHDLTGVWNMHATPAQRKFLNSTYTAEPPDMTAWGKQRYDEAKPSNGPRSNPLNKTNDPVLRNCLPPGTPRIYLQPFPFQIVQDPKEVIMIFEYDHTVRHIYIDGRPHPPDVLPTYMGDSIGHWDGDTLVVDTIGFNTKTWLDRDGHGHSDQLHVIERIHRADVNHMQIGITMEDPKALAKPWKTTLYFQLEPKWNIMELACTDNAAFENFEK
jgi:hypothetical protein